MKLLREVAIKWCVFVLLEGIIGDAAAENDQKNEHKAFSRHGVT